MHTLDSNVGTEIQFSIMNVNYCQSIAILSDMCGSYSHD